MKFFILQLLLMLLTTSNFIFAQDKDVIKLVLEKDKFIKVDKKAIFIAGGDIGFRNKILEKIRTYEINQYDGIKGEYLRTYNEIRKKQRENDLELTSEELEIIKKIEERDVIISKLTFVVEVDGKLTNIATEGINESFNKEVERVVKEIYERWKPAYRGGKPVRSKYVMPIRMVYK